MQVNEEGPLQPVLVLDADKRNPQRPQQTAGDPLHSGTAVFIKKVVVDNDYVGAASATEPNMPTTASSATTFANLFTCIPPKGAAQ